MHDNMIQKPQIILRSEMTYNIDDIDGLLTMLNPLMSGCIELIFSKPMNTQVIGKIKIDDNEIPSAIFVNFDFLPVNQVIGIPVKSVMTEYDYKYNVDIEGFEDIDGEVMEPQQIEVRTLPYLKPDERFEDTENVALEAAKEGIVLLKNDANTLPLKSLDIINVFGKGQHEFRHTPLGAGKTYPRYKVRFLDGIRQFSQIKINEELEELYKCHQDLIPDRLILEKAKEKSDIAIVVISRSSGENRDNRAVKGEYYLTDEEDQLLKVISEEFTRTIVILNTGYLMDVRFIDKYNIKTAIYCGFPGMLGGKALAEILDGRVSPSGKLPDTWAYDYFDYPSSKNFINSYQNERLLGDDKVYIDTCYEEDIYVGYRYFETFQKKVAYTFGHGLSYTKFNINIIEKSYINQRIELIIAIKNIGNLNGKEVLQVYIKAPEGILEKPSMQLIDFAKTSTLNPGEREMLHFSISNSRYTSYDSDRAAYILEAGNYQVYVGTSLERIDKIMEFTLEQEEIVKRVHNYMCSNVEFPVLSKKDSSGVAGKFTKIKAENVITPRRVVVTGVEEDPIVAEVPAEIIYYSQVLKSPELLKPFIKQMSVEELARLNVCASSGWDMESIGEAGRIFVLDKYGMKDYIVADGNNGVNLRKPNIGMPSSLVVCATFNKNLAYEVGKAIAVEAKKLGVNMILAPALNIHRDPLCGRNIEYFSEDPLLSGIMAGNQGKGLEDNGVSSSVKHVLANNCESARKRNQSLVSERALREIYLKAFEIVFEIYSPDSIMTSYNAVNGLYPAESEELIQGILRKEWGFKGYVMTDWNTYQTVDPVSMVAAGNCWLTPGTKDDTFVSQIVDAVKQGRIQRERLEKNIYYLMRVVAKQHRKNY